MGFYLTGVKPANEAGESLRFAWRFWPVVWETAIKVADIPKDIAKSGFSNLPSTFVDRMTAKKIADRLASFFDKPSRLQKVIELVQANHSKPDELDKALGRTDDPSHVFVCIIPSSAKVESELQRFIVFCGVSGGFRIE